MRIQLLHVQLRTILLKHMLGVNATLLQRMLAYEIHHQHGKRSAGIHKQQRRINLLDDPRRNRQREDREPMHTRAIPILLTGEQHGKKRNSGLQNGQDLRNGTQRTEREDIEFINSENPSAPKITHKQRQTRHIKNDNHTIKHALYENVQILTQKTTCQQDAQRHRKRTGQIREMHTGPRTHRGKQIRMPAKHPEQENTQRAAGIQHKHQRKRTFSRRSPSPDSTRTIKTMYNAKNNVSTHVLTARMVTVCLLHKKARYNPTPAQV